MTEREIDRIRKKFILLSTLSFFGVMLLMGGCIFLFSTFTVRNEVRRIMAYIVENDGQLPVPDSGDIITEDTVPAPEAAFTVDDQNAGVPHDATADHKKPDAGDTRPSWESMDWSLRRIFGIGDITGQTADSFYSTRYFAVLFDGEGRINEVVTSHIASIDEETAERYALFVLNRRIRFGSFGRYYYQVAERETGGMIVIYLDRSAQMMSISRILFVALMLLGIGTLLAFYFMRLFSMQVVRSEVENAERQKQFITNASHELKTPLAVIRANTEMQEMLEGETEWTQSTMRQVDRLNGLVQNLVQISRAQETATGELTAMNIAPVVLETASSFVPVAAGDGKKLFHKVAENVTMEAEESMIRQLVSLLIDNAVKYCDPQGEIRVILARSMRYVVLTITNSYADGASVDYSRFFERFYRRDEARTIRAGSPEGTLTGQTVSPDTSGILSENSGRSGYGIGLSIADELVRALHGSIHVSWKNGVISFVCRFRASS